MERYSGSEYERAYRESRLSLEPHEVPAWVRERACALIRGEDDARAARSADDAVRRARLNVHA